MSAGERDLLALERERALAVGHEPQVGPVDDREVLRLPLDARLVRASCRRSGATIVPFAVKRPAPPANENSSSTIVRSARRARSVPSLQVHAVLRQVEAQRIAVERAGRGADRRACRGRRCRRARARPSRPAVPSQGCSGRSDARSATTFAVNGVVGVDASRRATRGERRSRIGRARARGAEARSWPRARRRRSARSARSAVMPSASSSGSRSCSRAAYQSPRSRLT